MRLTEHWKEITHLTLFPKRYATSRGKSREYWREVEKRYYNFRKRVGYSGHHWYLATYDDGRTELLYLRVCKLTFPHGGILCRGLLFPRQWTALQFEHVREIRIAF